MKLNLGKLLERVEQEEHESSPNEKTCIVMKEMQPSKEKEFVEGYISNREKELKLLKEIYKQRSGKL